ncbi:MAG TPA: glycosyltransferase family 39 protein [Anaerolineales bacterium]|nr:glycosyltransferase family 39 protein [Anaerolineales bacterium]
MKILKSENIYWTFIIGSLVILGCFCTGIYFLPFDSVKPWMDMLAKDGVLESFTPAIQQKLSFLGWSGVVFLGTAIGMGTAKKISQRMVLHLLSWLRQTGTDLINDGQILFRKIGNLLREKPACYGLIGITIAASLSRVILLSRPMTYDEAYSFNNFAANSWIRVVTDYHLPNNHIFHNLLLHWGYTLLGNHPWVVRLPAFLAGVLMIPAAYLVGRAFFESFSALLGAALIASSSIFLFFSSTARGYTLICLFTLLILGLGAYTLHQPNRTAWGLMALFSVLGLYTIPVMLYPLAVIVIWLVLSWTFGTAPRDPNFVRYLAIFAATTVVITGILYLPVIAVNGAHKLFGNSFISPLEDGVFQTKLMRKLDDVWSEWNKGTLPYSEWLFTAGLVISLVFHQRISPQYRFPMPLVMVLTLSGIIWAQRVAPPDRVFLFTLPILLLWAAVGLAWVLQGTIGRISASTALWKLTRVALLVFFSIMPLIPGLAWQEKISKRQLYAPEMTLQLREVLVPGDVVIVAFPDDAPIRYYFDLYNVLEDQAFQYDQFPIQSATVIVNEVVGQTLESVLKAGNFPSDWLDIASAQRLTEYRHVSAYRLMPNYPLHPIP